MAAKYPIRSYKLSQLTLGQKLHIATLSYFTGEEKNNKNFGRLENGPSGPPEILYSATAVWGFVQNKNNNSQILIVQHGRNMEIIRNPCCCV